MKGRPAAYTPALMIVAPAKSTAPGSSSRREVAASRNESPYTKPSSGAANTSRTRATVMATAMAAQNEPITFRVPLRKSPAAAGTTSAANELDSVKTISETLVATE